MAWMNEAWNNEHRLGSAHGKIVGNCASFIVDVRFDTPSIITHLLYTIDIVVI